MLSYLERIDRALCHPATLCVYGSAACILLDEPDRTSMDIDVAAPYSLADYGDLRQAAEAAGLPLNPDEHHAGNHIEWITALRLCLPRPNARTQVSLWQGSRLTVMTVPVEQLIASKLIRYDPLDQGDIRFLLSRRAVSFQAVARAVRLLPEPFRGDVVVQENLRSLKTDMAMWGGTR